MQKENLSWLKQQIRGLNIGIFLKFHSRISIDIHIYIYI